MKLPFWNKKSKEIETKIDAAAPKGLAASLKLLFKKFPLCGTLFRDSWTPDIPRRIGNCYGYDFNGRVMTAFEEVQNFFVNKLNAVVTVINDTTDHFGKPYQRFELCLMNNERYLMDFYVQAGLWKGDNVTKRLYGMCRIYIDPVRHIDIDLVRSTIFGFDDTFLWDSIYNRLGLPASIPVYNREYYFKKEDYEFRKEYFDFRSKGGNNVQ